MKLKIEIEVNSHKKLNKIDFKKFLLGSILSCSCEVDNISVKEIKEIVNPELELPSICLECNIPIDICDCIKKYYAHKTTK